MVEQGIYNVAGVVVKVAPRAGKSGQMKVTYANDPQSPCAYIDRRGDGAWSEVPWTANLVAAAELLTIASPDELAAMRTDESAAPRIRYTTLPRLPKNDRHF